MISTKLVNQLLLGSVACSISFILGLLVHRNLQRTLLTSAVSVTACYAAATVINRRRQHKEQHRDSLAHQIRTLESQETQLCQTLASATALQQNLEASIEALGRERTQLLHRITELHCQRNSLYRSVSNLQKQRQQQEEIYQAQQLKLEHLERRKDEIRQSLYSQITQIKPTQKRLQTLQREFEHIQRQILERQELHQKIDFSLVTLESQKRYLEIEVANLHAQLDDLANLYEQLGYSILQSRTTKQKLEESLIIQEEKIQKAQAAVSNDVSPLAFQKWLDFYSQLSHEDKNLLKTLLEQNEETLRQIAAQKDMSLETLIDNLNKNAVNVLGNALFIHTDNSIIPAIHEKYQKLLLQPTLISLKDLL